MMKSLGTEKLKGSFCLVFLGVCLSFFEVFFVFFVLFLEFVVFRLFVVTSIMFKKILLCFFDCLFEGFYSVYYGLFD